MKYDIKNIKRLEIPSSVKSLHDGWCHYLRDLREKEVYSQRTAILFSTIKLPSWEEQLIERQI